MSTIALAHNPILHAQTKHMELDLFFVKEKVLFNHIGRFVTLLSRTMSEKPAISADILPLQQA